MLGAGEVKPAINDDDNQDHEQEDLPERHELLVVRVVEALVGVLAGVVPPVPPVLYEEGGALKLESVHTHLSVHIQLGIEKMSQQHNDSHISLVCAVCSHGEYLGTGCQNLLVICAC